MESEDILQGKEKIKNMEDYVMKLKLILTSGMKMYAVKAMALMTSAAILLSTAAPSVYATTDTNTQIPTSTSAPAETATPTATPEMTVAPTATPETTVAPTATPEATVAPTATPEATVAPTATPEMTVAPTATPEINNGVSFANDVSGFGLIAPQSSVYPTGPAAELISVKAEPGTGGFYATITYEVKLSQEAIDLGYLIKGAIVNGSKTISDDETYIIAQQKLTQAVYEKGTFSLGIQVNKPTAIGNFGYAFLSGNYPEMVIENVAITGVSYDVDTQTYTIKAESSSSDAVTGNIINDGSSTALTFNKLGDEYIATYNVSSLLNSSSEVFEFEVFSGAKSAETRSILKLATAYDHNGGVFYSGYQLSDAVWEKFIPADSEFPALSEGEKLQTGVDTYGYDIPSFYYIKDGKYVPVASNTQVAASTEIRPIILSDVTFVSLDGSKTVLTTDFRGYSDVPYTLETNLVPALTEETNKLEYKWVDENGTAYTSSQVASASFTNATTLTETAIEKTNPEDFKTLEFAKVYDGTPLYITNGHSLDITTDIRAAFIASHSEYKDFESLAIKVTYSETNSDLTTFGYAVQDVRWEDYENRNTNKLTESDIAPYVIEYNVITHYENDEPVYVTDLDGNKYVGRVELKVYPRLISANAGSFGAIEGSDYMLYQTTYTGGYRINLVSGNWAGFITDSDLAVFYSANQTVKPEKPFLELDNYKESNGFLSHDDINVYHPEILNGNIQHTYLLQEAIHTVHPEFDYSDKINMKNYFIGNETVNYMNVIAVDDYSFTKVYDGTGHTLVEGVEETNFLEEIKNSYAYSNIEAGVLGLINSGEYEVAIRFYDEATQSFTKEEYTSPAQAGVYEVPFKLLIADRDGNVVSEEDAAVYFDGVTFSDIQDVVNTTNSYLATITITEVEAIPTPPPTTPITPPTTPEVPVLPVIPVTPETEIDTPDVPATDGEGENVEIDDATAPLASGAAWALVNLILAILTAFISVALLITYFKSKDDEEWDMDEAKRKRKGAYRILSVILALVAAITFILTEDITQPMILIDKWTLLMAIYAVIQVIVARLSRKEVEIDEEEIKA